MVISYANYQSHERPWDMAMNFHGCAIDTCKLNRLQVATGYWKLNRIKHGYRCWWENEQSGKLSIAFHCHIWLSEGKPLRCLSEDKWGKPLYSKWWLPGFINPALSLMIQLYSHIVINPKYSYIMVYLSSYQTLSNTYIYTAVYH